MDADVDPAAAWLTLPGRHSCALCSASDVGSVKLGHIHEVLQHGHNTDL